MEELSLRMLAFRFLLLGMLKLFLHSCIENALHFNKQKKICHLKKKIVFVKLRNLESFLS